MAVFNIVAGNILETEWILGDRIMNSVVQRKGNCSWDRLAESTTLLHLFRLDIVSIHDYSRRQKNPVKARDHDILLSNLRKISPMFPDQLAKHLGMTYMYAAHK
jgi:hypothetical protein